MAYKLYLKLDGLTPREGQGIEVQSFSWGISNTATSGTGGGGGSGKVQLHDLTITKSVDKTSPLLVQACASGKHFQKLDLSAISVNSDGQPDFDNPVYKLDLGNVVIDSVQVSGSEEGADLPFEAVSLHYLKFEVIV